MAYGVLEPILPAPVYSFDWSTSGTALTNNPFSIASLDDRMARLTLRTTLPNVRYGSKADVMTTDANVRFVPQADISGKTLAAGIRRKFW